MLDVSRERVRQVELKALRKLRNLTRRIPPAM
jgi:RNA polymerase primary sigma factor